MKYVCSKDVICGPGSGMLEIHLKEGKIPKEYDAIDICMILRQDSRLIKEDLYIFLFIQSFYFL